MPIYISEQHLYFSWLRILGIQLRLLTSLVHVEHRSMIPSFSVTLYSGHSAKMWHFLFIWDVNDVLGLLVARCLLLLYYISSTITRRISGSDM